MCVCVGGGGGWRPHLLQKGHLFEEMQSIKLNSLSGVLKVLFTLFHTLCHLSAFHCFHSELPKFVSLKGSERSNFI